MTTLPDIIYRLGGSSAIQAALGCSASAVSMWRTRGIPDGVKFRLLALAEGAGKALSVDELNKADALIRLTLGKTPIAHSGEQTRMQAHGE